MPRKQKTAKEVMRRISLILDKTRSRGARGHAAIKRDRKQKIGRGVRPSELLFRL